MEIDNRLAEIKKLFNEVVHLSPEEREKYLQKLNTTFDGIRTEVAALLKAHDRAPEMLEYPNLDFNLTNFEEVDYSGQMIGAYRIIRQIGKGGMGLVFLAERADGQYEKQVALKIIRRGLDSKELVQRFLNERQTLALLNHPGIARFLEGGLTETGIPYIVMDYIEGVPIDKYCKDKNLSVTQRLPLFSKVCEAVQYLHQNLIVHRDLKPANILVTPDGNPVLLDFGIVKLLAPAAAAEKETLTQTGMWLMTPEYASPEQVRGKAITVASDVYTLGVMLYELLTGRRPYKLKNRLPQEIEHAICEAEPTRPSVAARQELTENMFRRLRGDLDVIILKALRKEPAKRYFSVQEMANDIHRYLNGEPVKAQKNTVLYRGQKFVRRNWIGVSVVFVFLVLIGLFIFNNWQKTQRIVRERDKAEQVSTFLIDLFKTSSPEEARGDTITARQILDRGAEKIQRELAAQPEVQATMMDVIGQVYHELGIYAEADSMFENSLRIRERIYDEPGIELAQSLEHKGKLRQTLGKYFEAESLLLAADEIYRRSAGEQGLQEIKSLETLSNVYFQKGEYILAEKNALKVIALKEKYYGENSLELAETYQLLGEIYFVRTNSENSFSAFQKALDIRKEILGKNHPLIAESMDGVGKALRFARRFDEALKVLNDVYQMRINLFGKNHVSIINTLSFINAIHYWKKEYTVAESLMFKIIDIRRQLFGDEHPALAIDLNNVAGVLAIQNKYEEALPFYYEAQKINQSVYTKTDPRYSHILGNLTGALYYTGHISEAEEIFPELFRLIPKLENEDPLRAANILEIWGLILLEKKRFLESEKFVNESIRLYQKSGREEMHLTIQDCKNILGQALTAQGRYAEAESLLINSYPVLEANRPKYHRITTAALKRIINLYQVWGKPEKAVPYQKILQESEAEAAKLRFASK